jgi:Ca-activated chloride channel family protein
MNFKHPEFFWLLILVPLLIGFLSWAYQNKLNNLKKLSARSRFKQLIPNFSKKVLFIRYSCLVLSLSFLIIALISPRWGYDYQEIEQRGTNIMVALDVSRSMLASDVKPSRLVRAKLEVKSLINNLQGDRMGLIVFAGRAFLQVPMTHDYMMLQEWLDRISVDSVPVPGTSIRSALELTKQSMSHIKGDNLKTLIIISDGEEQDEETLEMAKSAKDSGIRIISIGIGSKKGSPITYEGELIKDENDEIVISKLNDTLLKQIAKLTDGKYVQTRTGNFHLEQLYQNFIKAKSEDTLLKSSRIKRWFETYQIFLSISLIFLILELVLMLDILPRISKVFRKKGFKSGLKLSKIEVYHHHSSLIALILLSIFLSMQPASAYSLTEFKADQALKKGNFSKAKSLYLKAQVDEPNNPRLNYNLGICNYKLGAMPLAIKDFKRSLTQQLAAEAKHQPVAGSENKARKPLKSVKHKPFTDITENTKQLLDSVEVNSQSKLKSAPDLSKLASKSENEDENKKKSTNIQSLDHLSVSDRLKYKSYFNLGNAYFKQEKYYEAYEAYRKANQLNSDDQDLKHNLEVTEKFIEHDKQQQQGEDNQDDKDKGKDQQEQDKQKQEQEKQQKQAEQDKMEKQQTENLLKQIQEAGAEFLPKIQAPASDMDAGKLKPW